MLPNRVKLSKVATDKFRNIKMQTGVTPNYLARIAIMLALKDGSSLSNIGSSDQDPDSLESTGQVLDKSVLFGDYVDVYEILINQFVHDHKIEDPLHKTIVSLIDAGVHKMGHIKSLQDLCQVGHN